MYKVEKKMTKQSVGKMPKAEKLLSVYIYIYIYDSLMQKDE